MKKALYTLPLIFLLAGCDGDVEASNSESNAELNIGSITEDSQSEELVLSTTEGIDVDLTILSSTMVYSQVFDMLSYADDYMGKTIKMAGEFNYYTDEETGVTYLACLIEDALACCQSGFEFIWEGHNFPEDYPEPYSEIEVIGVFHTYEEGGFEYAYLDASSVRVIEN